MLSANDELGIERWRLVGVPTDQLWKTVLPAGAEGSCDVVIRRENGEVVVGSCTGQVWPSAWPDCFTALPASVQAGAGGYQLTKKGLALFARHAPQTKPQKRGGKKGT